MQKMRSEQYLVYKRKCKESCLCFKNLLKIHTLQSLSIYLYNCFIIGKTFYFMGYLIQNNKSFVSKQFK